MTIIFNVIEAEWITSLIWLGWQFRTLVLQPLWERTGLDSDDVE